MLFGKLVLENILSLSSLSLFHLIFFTESGIICPNTDLVFDSY